MSDKQVTPAQRRVATLRDLIEKSKGQIKAALPKHMDADRLARVAMTSIQKTPELLECDPVSVVRSVIEAAQLGLEPDGVLGHAYLVPYKKKCTLIVGYKGMIGLAYRSGLVSSIGGQVVYDKDTFDVAFGIEEKLVHKPNLTEKDRGAPVCVYAIAHMKDGGHAFVVLSVHEVERHRKRSAMPNSPAWQKDWDAMAVKTAVRGLARWIPQCPELQRMASREEAMDAGVEPDGEITIDITDTQASAKPASRAAEAAEKIKGQGKAEPKEADPDPDDDDDTIRPEDIMDPADIPDDEEGEVV